MEADPKAEDLYTKLTKSVKCINELKQVPQTAKTLK